MAMGGGGAMPLQAMPMQQAMPQFDGPTPQAAAAPARGGAAPGAGDLKKEGGRTSDGAAACLALEFSGAAVRAACWDAASKKPAPLPFDAERTGACAAAVAVTDDAKFAAWCAKLPKTRAVRAPSGIIPALLREDARSPAGGGTVVEGGSRPRRGVPRPRAGQLSRWARSRRRRCRHVHRPRGTR